MIGKIRLAKKSDVKRILDLYNSDENLRADETSVWEKEDIRGYIDNSISKVFVYELNGEIIGVCIGEFWKKYVYLHTIIVDKKHRERE